MAKKSLPKCSHCSDTGYISYRGKTLADMICQHCDRGKNIMPADALVHKIHGGLSWLWRKIRGKEDRITTSWWMPVVTIVTVLIWTCIALTLYGHFKIFPLLVYTIMGISIIDCIPFNFLTMRIFRGLGQAVKSLYQKGKTLMKKNNQDEYRGTKFVIMLLSVCYAATVSLIVSMSSLEVSLETISLLHVITWLVIPGAGLWLCQFMNRKGSNQADISTVQVLTGDPLEQLLQEKLTNELPEINLQAQNIAAKIEELKNQRSQAQSRLTAIAGKSLLQRFEPELQDLINKLDLTVSESEMSLEKLGIIRNNLNQQIEGIRIQLNDRTTAQEIEKFLTAANAQASKVSNEIQASIIIACEKLQATSDSLRQLCSDLLASLGLEPSQYMDKLSSGDRLLLEKINRPAADIRQAVESQRLKIRTT